MIDDIESRTLADDPTPEDFEAAEIEAANPSVWAIVGRLLRVAVALLVVAALLFYFVVPYGNIFGGSLLRWSRSTWRTHTIPMAPQRKEAPKLPA